MSAVFLLVAAGAVVAGGFLAAFVWAVRSGQFDDLVSPPVRVVLPERVASSPYARSSSEGQPHA
jgi:cbb3-type cytochrome oxidase maturation protein